MAGKKLRHHHQRSNAQGSGSVSGGLVRTQNVSTASVNRSKSADELASMTKEQLKTECRKRGQKTTGNKTELLQRLGCKATTMAQVKRKDATATTNGTATPPASHDDASVTSRGGDTSQHGGGSSSSSDKARKEKERAERENIVLWKSPLTTVEYSTKEVIVLLRTYGKRILTHHKSLVLLVLVTVLAVWVSGNTPGPHQRFVQAFYKKSLWCLYWIGLGILSSVGLGTGLHTFILYLGPHIAQVTLAAYECGTLDFPEPPYPDEIICPDVVNNALTVSILGIMSKVRLEAMCWGAGTALGELPPYFMARASRLSGRDDDEDEDDDLKEFEELQRKQSNRNELTVIEKGKLFVEDLVQRVGFLGILACASIPNPLFDLAGITCGHFLVPFWTFFGATLIGKAVIKMHIQKLFVIIAFNETLIETVLDRIRFVPVVGEKLQEPFRAYLNAQKTKLHKGGAGGGAGGGGRNILGSLFEMFVVGMIVYFVVSIVNSFAQNYHKRIHKRKVAKN